MLRTPAPFIVGVPRSGTTLLRLMLDAHSALAIPSETHFIPALTALSGPPANQCEQFIQRITTFNTWSDFHLDAAAFAAAVRALRPFETGAALRVFYRLYAAAHGKTRWGDKTPLYGNHLGLIRSWLPETRFIHLIRDGRDVALSVRPLWFTPGSDLRSIAADWRDTLTRIRRDGQALGGYLEVRYEALLQDHARVLRGICDFLELDFDPAMLAYHATAAQRLGEMGHYRRESGEQVERAERLGQHIRTSQPPLKERAGAWRRDMSESEQREFRTEAGELLDALEYPT